jgi:EB module
MAINSSLVAQVNQESPSSRVSQLASGPMLAAEFAFSSDCLILPAKSIAIELRPGQCRRNVDDVLAGTILDNCTTTVDCSSAVNNSVCVSNQCQCQLGYIVNSNLTDCSLRE